jgi:hypothetical protein
MMQTFITTEWVLIGFKRAEADADASPDRARRKMLHGSRPGSRREKNLSLFGRLYMLHRDEIMENRPFRGFKPRHVSEYQ